MIERLVTIPERTARSALAEVIRRARHDCAAFGSDLAYDDPVWDVTASCPRPSNKSQTAAKIYYTTHEGGTSKSMKGRTALGEPFGAFVNLVPGKDGMVHVSELDTKRVENVEDVVKMGDEINVMVIAVEPGTGKVSLSRRAILSGETPEDRIAAGAGRSAGGGSRNGGGERRGPPRDGDSDRRGPPRGPSDRPRPRRREE